MKKGEYNSRVLTRKPFFHLLFVVCLILLGLSLTGTQIVSAGEAKNQDGQPFVQIQTLPPNEDGSITHVVQYGETLIDIAQAYGITLQELYNRNRSLNPAQPSYFEGQVLMIRPPFTETPVVTATYTPNPPTRTPLPTRTPRPTYTATSPQSPTASSTPTIKPLIEIPTIDDLGSSRPLIAYAFIAISIVGLIVLMITAFLPKNRP